MEPIVFEKHREKILDQMMDASILVIFSKPKPDVKKDVDRNYYYVTGNFEFDNILVLIKNGNLKKK